MNKVQIHLGVSAVYLFLNKKYKVLIFVEQLLKKSKENARSVNGEYITVIQRMNGYLIS
jgi:hypothetical protein